MLERDPQRVRVRRRQADLVEAGEALVEALGALDEVEQVRVVRAERGREHALPGGDEVLGRHRVPVGPAGARAEEERVGQLVGGHVPALGDPRDGVQVDRVLGHEALAEGGEHVIVARLGGEVGIEVGEVVPDPAMEHLLAVAGLHRGLAREAAGERRERGREPEEGAERESAGPAVGGAPHGAVTPGG